MVHMDRCIVLNWVFSNFYRVILCLGAKQLFLGENVFLTYLDNHTASYLSSNSIGPLVGTGTPTSDGPMAT